MEEIEGFGEIIGIIAMAKELYDIGRFDIVKEEFFDTLCYDSWLENTYAVISSVFSGVYSNYDDLDETETMIFTDDVISDYYCLAWEYGRTHNVPHSDNPFVLEAEQEMRRRFSFCCSVGWKLLDYTKTKKTAKQSKLIIYAATCECDCHTNLAYSLVKLYKWFTDKVSEFKGKNKSETKEVLAA